MLNGHSPITHGNILDVSENIQNGKIRLDNIAPQLTIKFTGLGSSDQLFYWEFVFPRDSGSTLANLQEMQEFGWLYYTRQYAAVDASYRTVSGLNYVGFEVRKLASMHGRVHSDEGVDFKLGFSSADANHLLRLCERGNHFFVRVSGVSDVAGNELYGGTIGGEIINDAYLVVRNGGYGLVPSVVGPYPA